MMTNFEHYCIGAKSINDNSDIKLFISDDDWIYNWWNSKIEDLKDWLMAEYKPYKLTRFEWDLLIVFSRYRGGNSRFASFDILTDLKVAGYFNDIDVNKSISKILDLSEVNDEE